MPSATLPARNQIRTTPSVIVAIIAVSAVASSFLCWPVYYHTPNDSARAPLSSLPLLMHQPQYHILADFPLFTPRRALLVC